MHRRAIVYPQGLLPRAEARSHCDALLVLAGGDIQRQFERGGGSLTEFARFVARLPPFRLGHVEALVVLTTPAPLDAVVPTRRLLSQASAVLDRATWALFWDHTTTPKLDQSLVAVGHLDGPPNRAPLWTTLTGEVFWVLSTQTSPEVLVRRLRELQAGGGPESGFRRGAARPVTNGRTG